MEKTKGSRQANGAGAERRVHIAGVEPSMATGNGSPRLVQTTPGRMNSNERAAAALAKKMIEAAISEWPQLGEPYCVEHRFVWFSMIIAAGQAQKDPDLVLANAAGTDCTKDTILRLWGHLLTPWHHSHPASIVAACRRVWTHGHAARARALSAADGQGRGHLGGPAATGEEHQ